MLVQIAYRHVIDFIVLQDMGLLELAIIQEDVVLGPTHKNQHTVRLDGPTVEPQGCISDVNALTTYNRYLLLFAHRPHGPAYEMRLLPG